MSAKGKPLPLSTRAAISRGIQRREQLIAESAGMDPVAEAVAALQVAARRIEIEITAKRAELDRINRCAQELSGKLALKPPTCTPQTKAAAAERHDAILAVLAKHPQGLRAMDIAEAIGDRRSVVNTTLWMMAQKGELRSVEKGVYALAKTKVAA